jgi:alpha-tubulin suppressor-like RCC1 family protein
VLKVWITSDGLTRNVDEELARRYSQLYQILDYYGKPTKYVPVYNLINKYGIRLTVVGQRHLVKVLDNTPQSDGVNVEHTIDELRQEAVLMPGMTIEKILESGDVCQKGTVEKRYGWNSKLTDKGEVAPTAQSRYLRVGQSTARYFYTPTVYRRLTDWGLIGAEFPLSWEVSKSLEAPTEYYVDKAEALNVQKKCKDTPWSLNQPNDITNLMKQGWQALEDTRKGLNGNNCDLGIGFPLRSVNDYSVAPYVVADMKGIREWSRGKGQFETDPQKIFVKVPSASSCHIPKCETGTRLTCSSSSGCLNGCGYTCTGDCFALAPNSYPALTTISLEASPSGQDENIRVVVEGCKAIVRRDPSAVAVEGTGEILTGSFDPSTSEVRAGSTVIRFQKAEDGRFHPVSVTLEGHERDIEPTVKSVSQGGNFACALLTNGDVRCWGDGSVGQLGYGNTNTIGDDETPAVAGSIILGGKAKQVVTGGSHACALLVDGTVRCWGSGTYGQLGYGNTRNIGDYITPGSAGPVNVGAKVIQLAAGNTSTCALTESGAVKCWGEGLYGALGYGNTDNIGDNEMPDSVGYVNVGGTVQQIDMSNQQSCAVLTGGYVRCWGLNQYGNLGYTNTGNTRSIGDDESPASLEAINVGGVVTQVSVGESHTCALLDNKKVRCWGFGAYGALGYGNQNQIGDDETPASAGDVNVGSSVTKITVGNNFSCALLTTGDVRCWGEGMFGKLGYGNTENIGDNELPITAGPVSLAGKVLDIDSAGTGSSSCAVLLSGNVRCWGSNFNRQLGIRSGGANVGDDEEPSELQIWGVVTVYTPPFKPGLPPRKYIYYQ